MTAYAPQEGDIGLIAMAGTVGSLIRVGQWLNGDGFHDYQHAFVYVGSGKIIEAMPGGARMVDLGRYNTDEVLWLRCPPSYRQGVSDAAVSFHGVPYSAADYGALALHRFRIPTPRLRRFIERRKSMICSQLADAAAALGGWHIFDDGRWHGHVTPGDLTRVAMAQRPGQYIERWKGPR